MRADAVTAPPTHSARAVAAQRQAARLAQDEVAGLEAIKATEARASPVIILEARVCVQESTARRADMGPLALWALQHRSIHRLRGTPWWSSHRRRLLDPAQGQVSSIHSWIRGLAHRLTQIAKGRRSRCTGMYADTLAACERS